MGGVVEILVGWGGLLLLCSYDGWDFWVGDRDRAAIASAICLAAVLLVLLFFFLRSGVLGLNFLVDRSWLTSGSVWLQVMRS
jgi:hypothetical protein